MQILRQRIGVSFDYTVHFTRDLFQSDNPLLTQILCTGQTPARVLLVMDSGLARATPELLGLAVKYFEARPELLQLAGPPVRVPGGEVAKNNLHWLESLQQVMCDSNLCRHSYVLVVGGGAVLDMVGFAAAITHRGLRLVRVPSTVLAQNDAGIGIKNGINAFGKKNIFGAFAPPFAVINDLSLLQTLPLRDWRAGMAEAIKVALIRDTDFFHWIARSSDLLLKRDDSVMEQLIYRCAELHLAHLSTAGDPFETGSSRPLDFGHWAGHKLEQLSDNALRHGEAVAIGIALDSSYSYLAGRLGKPEWKAILRMLRQLGFDLWVPLLESARLFDGLEEFREHLGGELTLTLLAGIGKEWEVHAVDVERYRDAIRLLAEWQAQDGDALQNVAGIQDAH